MDFLHPGRPQGLWVLSAMFVAAIPSSGFPLIPSVCWCSSVSTAACVGSLVAVGCSRSEVCVGSLPLECMAVLGRARIPLSPSFCSSLYMTFIVIIISAFVILPTVCAARAACFIAWNKAVVSNPLSDHYLPLMLLKSRGRVNSTLASSSPLPFVQTPSRAACGALGPSQPCPHSAGVCHRGGIFALGEARSVENELNRAQCLRGQMEPEVPVGISALSAWHQIGSPEPAWGESSHPPPPPNLQPNGALAPAHTGTALSHAVTCRGALLVLEMPLGKDLGFVLCDRRQRFGVTELWLWGSPSVCGRFQNVPHLLPWHWGGGSDALDAAGM